MPGLDGLPNEMLSNLRALIFVIQIEPLEFRNQVLVFVQHRLEFHLDLVQLMQPVWFQTYSASMLLGRCSRIFSLTGQQGTVWQPVGELKQQQRTLLDLG